jgi:glycosyltransferase involved in cell wall biosynthesis
MSVLYATGVRFAGGGVGRVTYHAVRGLYRNGLLRRLLCGSYVATEIPRERIRSLGLPSRLLRKAAVYDRSRTLSLLDAKLFDWWMSQRLEQADLFHSWIGFGLQSLKRSKAAGLLTSVECPSCHPLRQYALLADEYETWGVRFNYPSAPIDRALAEFEVADYVLVPSGFARQTFIDNGFPEGRLLQLLFGVDTERFTPARSRRCGPFRVLFVGQLSLRKGVPWLLEAWQRLGWRDAELWLVGRLDGDLAPLLGRYAHLPGIRRIGYTMDPLSIYQQADLFVFPSIEEGSALVTYEALACGVPVITTPNAGSIVRHGENGLLVPIRDTDALSNAMERLRVDATLRQQMAATARQQVAAYTWDRYGDRLAQTFLSLLDGSHVEH